MSGQPRHARLPLGALALVNSAVSIGLMAFAAWLTHEPLVFPSLGPTAFLLFYRPHAEASCPRNALIGHLIGALAGLGALAIFGLLHQGPALTHVSTTRIGAAATSLGVTAAGMIWMRTPHPPAGATTLIVSLGFLHTPAAVGVLMVGVTLLVAQGLAVNRWAGIDYPLWAPRHLTRTTPSDGGSPMMKYTLFVDAIGDAAASDTALQRLHDVLATEAHDLTCSSHEWTALFTVAAADLEEAARILRRRVDAADAAAGLTGWQFTCYQVHETLLPLDDDAAHWHPRLPSLHRSQH